MQTIRMTLAKTPLAIRIVLLYGIVVVSIFAIAAGIRQQQPQIIYAEANPPALEARAAEVAKSAKEVSGTPVQLDAPSVDLSLEVLPGSYNVATKEWTLDITHAFFAAQSEPAGTEAGTTFIYGHNRASAFGPLSGLTVGDTVSLTIEDGSVLTYEYARDSRVSPESVSVIYEKSAYPQLVLMTCEGLFSDVRRVMYFTLKEVV